MYRSEPQSDPLLRMLRKDLLEQQYGSGAGFSYLHVARPFLGLSSHGSCCLSGNCTPAQRSARCHLLPTASQRQPERASGGGHRWRARSVPRVSRRR